LAMPERSTTIGFIGTGLMGRPIAANLLAAGYSLAVHNRTREKTQPLLEKGAVFATRYADAAKGGVVFTMVADDAVLESVCLSPDGIVGRLGEGGLHVSLSTIAPATATKLAAVHREHGEDYVAAPVFGRPDGAERAALIGCVAGPSKAKARAREMLQSTCSQIFDMGENPSTANVVKLAGNFMMAAAIEAMAEAYTLAEKNGIARERIDELFGSTMFACPIYQEFGTAVARHQYKPAAFFLPLGLKDMALVQQTATQCGMPMPIANLLHDRFVSSIAKGRTDVDWSALAVEVSDAAGLHVEI